MKRAYIATGRYLKNAAFMAPQASRARKGGTQNEKASDNHSLGYCRSISCDELLRSREKDEVTVTGSQVTRGDESFMLATNVKRGNEVLRLRNKDGNPEWIGWKKSE